MKNWTTIMLCRAGVIAALYAVLTWALGEFAFGPFQIRPSEALTILPIFYIEAIPGLYIGCMLANLLSGYGIYDIFVGSIATLLAATISYLCGRFIKNNVLKVALGGLAPVLANAFIIPAVFILAGADGGAYWLNFASFLLTEGIWVYVLGIPLWFAITGLQKKGVRVFMPYSKKPPEDGTGRGAPPPEAKTINEN